MQCKISSKIDETKDARGLLQQNSTQLTDGSGSHMNDLPIDEPTYAWFGCSSYKYKSYHHSYSSHNKKIHGKTTASGPLDLFLKH